MSEVFLTQGRERGLVRIARGVHTTSLNVAGGIDSIYHSSAAAR